MTTSRDPFLLSTTAARLRADRTVEPLAMDATFFQRIAAGELGSFRGEFLLTTFNFDSDWPVWERHPDGDEIVCLLSGSATFVLEHEHDVETVHLHEPGAWLIVPRGLWHTAHASVPCRMLFVTAGEGTEHREAG
jgi:quercetin dioxygenase-like cupin family protein